MIMAHIAPSQYQFTIAIPLFFPKSMHIEREQSHQDFITCCPRPLDIKIGFKPLCL